MSTVDRRHFLMSSVALPAALKASATAESEQHREGSGRRIQRSRQGAHLRVPEDAKRRDRGALRRRSVGRRCRLQDDRSGGQEAAGDLRGLPQAARRQEHRRRLDRDAELSPHAADDLGRSGRQGRPGREAGLVQHVRSPADRRGSTEVQPDRAGRHRRAGLAPRSASRRSGDGIIGDVYMARGLVFKWRDTIGRAKEEPAPPGVAYDLWTGPAPAKPFTRNRFHYNWHWQWDYGNGDIGNQGAHQMHAARFALGVKYPTKISSMGGHYLFDDDQETPNTLVATFEFEDGGKKKMLVFEVRHWISNNEAGIGERSAPTGGGAAEPVQTIGNIWYGSKGYLATGGGGWRTFMGPEQAPGPEVRSWRRRRRLRQLHRCRPQPQTRRSAGGDRGRRDLDDADSPGQHLVPHRPHAELRSGQLHVQGRSRGNRDVHAATVPGAVHRAERRRVRHRVGLELFLRKEAGEREGQAGDGR